MKSLKSYFFATIGLAVLAGSLALSGAARTDDQHLDGSWNAVVTATDPPSLPPLKVLLTFTHDGEVVETRRLYNPFSPFGPLLFTPAHGAWERTANNQFAVTIVDFFQAAPNNPAADGTVLGEEKVRFSVMLGPGGESLSGTLVGEVRDSGGNLIFTFSANVQATRINAEPLN